MNKLILFITLGGIFLVIVLLGIVAFLQRPREETVTNRLVSPTPIFSNDSTDTNSFEPPITNKPNPTAVPGNWYEHNGLTFRLPLDWKIESSGNVLMAQPKSSSSVTDLPRLQIIVDRPKSDASYISPSRRYANFQANREVIEYNSLINSAYKSSHPDLRNQDSSRLIEDRITILENEDIEYTLYFQYSSSERNHEQIYYSILGSLQYQ